jgi:pimeloyl-ACP methyl ester carboxylesterase
MSTQTLTIAGNTLTFDRYGNGSPVLLLHGAFQTRYLWRAVAAELAKTHTVIAPDLRGIGESGAGDGAFDMKTVAAEQAALMTALAFDQFAAIASQYANRVTRFAFLDMLLPGFGFEDAWIPRPNGQFLWFAALNSVPGLIETLLKGRERDYLEHVLRGGFTANKAGITDADIAEYTRAYSKPGVLAALGGYFRAMWANAEDNKASAQIKLTMPVLAMGGEYSVGAMAAQSMNAVATNVESMIVPGSGHWLPEENAAAVISSLVAFLSQN